MSCERVLSVPMDTCHCLDNTVSANVYCFALFICCGFCTKLVGSFRTNILLSTRRNLLLLLLFGTYTVLHCATDVNAYSRVTHVSYADISYACGKTVLSGLTETYFCSILYDLFLVGLRESGKVL